MSNPLSSLSNVSLEIIKLCYFSFRRKLSFMKKLLKLDSFLDYTVCMHIIRRRLFLKNLLLKRKNSNTHKDLKFVLYPLKDDCWDVTCNVCGVSYLSRAGMKSHSQIHERKRSRIIKYLPIRTTHFRPMEKNAIHWKGFKSISKHTEIIQQ